MKVLLLHRFYFTVKIAEKVKANIGSHWICFAKHLLNSSFLIQPWKLHFISEWLVAKNSCGAGTLAPAQLLQG